MADIKFRDTAHRDFFLENMMKCRVNDCYHRAFFLCDGYRFGNEGEHQPDVQFQGGLHRARGYARRLADKRNSQGLPSCF